MTTEVAKKKSKILGIPAGVVLGLLVLGYVFSLNGKYGDMIAFPLIFFPMLATIGLAAIANLVFWFATGTTPKRASPGALTNEELLAQAQQRKDRHWTIACYRHLQPIVMVGAGYLSMCPLIGIVLLK